MTFQQGHHYDLHSFVTARRCKIHNFTVCLEAALGCRELPAAAARLLAVPHGKGDSLFPLAKGGSTRSYVGTAREELPCLHPSACAQLPRRFSCWPRCRRRTRSHPSPLSSSSSPAGSTGPSGLPRRRASSPA